MQWRRIFFSFMILFGAVLWVLPSSALATTSVVCVRTASASDHTCPAYTNYSPTGCAPAGPWGTPPTYEHACTASVDSCVATIGKCLSSCDNATSFRNASCEASQCTGADAGKFWCVDTAKFNAATITAGPPACTPPSCTPNPLTPNNVEITVKNPLAFSTVEGILGSLLGALQGIIVVLALISIVIGGILYITSAGNDERMKTAKGAITAAAIGLALGLAAPSFLKQIGDILGWGPVVPGAAVAGAKSLSAIALSALQFLLSVVGVLGIIMLVIGGLTYITSAGNEERSESGKKIVMYAIIGIAVALASLVIVTQVAGLFAP